ncbi:sensor histidine kinase [Kineosporia babensis]|uniref:histidine kinase n=1 Tax=Kineosporia babensis TaxID=499548 RepID=A0A9X1T0X6_9ACTN|nr:HAMP domain-containing sensor histidine kinase [Kineosporia babensis]MCD5313258.1 HAMP domain-containing histidine kinase [Kineosporia babensis]
MRSERPPGLSLRMQLTLSYTGFLMLAGAALFAVMLLVLRYVPNENLMIIENGGFAPRRTDLLEVALRFSAAGLIFLAVVGLVAGWVLAGRMLRPLEMITQAAQAASQGSLSHRIAMPGRDDELHRLADTFDQMLARLERAFEEQRRFTANASHELRTPQTVMKTMLQVARANPEAVDLHKLLPRLQEMNDRSIDTHEALLQLARAEREDLPRQPCDLAEVVQAVVGSESASVSVSLTAALVHANPPLLHQLVENLVRNAVVHNLPEDGRIWADVAVGPDGRARFTIANTGEPITADVAATLTEPFVRARGRVRSGGHNGSGLGLAIVASIARIHHADLTVAPRPDGGLMVTVIFPAVTGD